MKNLVITDYELPEQFFKNSVIVNLNNIQFSTCNGGLKCLKCEGKCPFQDDLSLVSKWMNDCRLIIYIARVKYGCFDISFKRLIERMVVNLEPYYVMVDGETCHLNVSQLHKKLVVIGYGDINEDEKELFNDLLDQSSLGYSYTSIDSYFCEEDELEEVIRTFGGIDHG